MIGVVGDGRVGERAASALRDADFDVTTGLRSPSADTEPPEVVIAAGERGLVDFVESGLDVPVLPVALGAGLPSAAVTDSPPTIEAYRAGKTTSRRHPLLAVEAAGEPVGRAVFDAMLVRSEPGRISEYSISAPAASSSFRADGVVAATPAGSHGYANAAGGPRLGLDAEAVVVVPVAAFGLGAPAWVLDLEAGLELRVERDEGDVSLLVDGRARRTLSGRASVVLTPGGTIETIEPPTG